MAERKYQFDDPEAAFAEAEKRIQQALNSGATKLDLSDLGLAEVPESLGQLTELRKLFLQHNKLKALPQSLANLIRLEDLNLTHNKLTELPDSLVRLIQLQTLGLGGNNLISVPESIAQLTQLRELYLWGGRLTALPESLGQLTRLRMLSLYENQLTMLPESLRKLTSLKELYLQNNPMLGLPPEVLEPTFDDTFREHRPAKSADILDYYFRVRAGKHPLNEAKLILLGRGEVGKTCMVNRLVHDKFKSTKMTKGIAITQWPVAAGKDTVRLHVWDFGGQEIQHATHQFFLTERSLYLVVLNGRAGDEENDAEYWLKFVKTFGASSPTIVVLNKFKVQPFQVNRPDLQEKYPFIRAFVETDCKSKSKNGIAGLKREIESALAAMDYTRADFPAGWFQIKERLAEMKEPFISFAEYRKICAELGENDAQAQERLAGFLNALGIALNFREDLQLREETVLNPHWITEGVYQIITSKALAGRQGELRLADLTRILPKKAYPARMHGFLIELMRKFELCFPFHDDPAEHRYLVPELLGKEQPALKEPFPPRECLNFRYDYRLMPEGLLPRFITRTHTMSEPSERWRTGVVLRWEGCRALVKADRQERQVLVRVLGSEVGQVPLTTSLSPTGGEGARRAGETETHTRRRLLAVIRQNFDQIHAEMKEFKPTEWVALEGKPDAWTSVQELEVFERQRVAVVPKTVGQEVVSVEVAKELDKADVPGVRKMDVDRMTERRPLKLFISYAHEDEKWRARLAPNLGLLQREGLVEVWSDLEIVPGMKWDDEIKRNVEEADLYLFLVSTDLLNSSYVLEHELPIAKQRDKDNNARLVPVIVRACNWNSDIYFRAYQALPKAGKPVREWEDRDQAFLDVEDGLRKTIAEVRKMLGRT